MRRLAALVVAGVAAVVAGGFAFFLLRGSNEPPPPRLQGTEIERATGDAFEVRPGSFAGYRVDEEYLGVGVSTAVGRTRAVVGRIGVDGTRIVSARLEADLTQLRSDEGQRDDALRTRGIETARYPRAVFSLRQPFALAQREQTVRGLLLLHGRRAPVSVRVSGSLSAQRLELVGRAPIDFDDFAIEPPSVAGLVTVRSQGIVEFKLVATPV